MSENRVEDCVEEGFLSVSSLTYLLIMPMLLNAYFAHNNALLKTAEAISVEFDW